MLQAAAEEGAKHPPPDIPEEDRITPADLTVAQLQEQLSKRSLETKWNPLKGKKELVERLKVPYSLIHRLPRS